jgi:hypothetical protein
MGSGAIRVTVEDRRIVVPLREQAASDTGVWVFADKKGFPEPDLS